MIALGVHERVWLWYLLTASTIVALFGLGDPLVDGAGTFLLLHGVLAGVVCTLPCAFRRPLPLAAARAAFSAVGLPAVYFGLALVLPQIHPEPYEFRWIAVDRALFGTDPTVALQDRLTPWLVEVLQLCYASFYAIPIVAVLAAGRRHGLRVFESSLVLVVFGFTLSYLGYLLWPTLPPYHYLPHTVPIRGVWFAERLHEVLDAAEVQRWNCFPSGHTMLSLLSLWIAWRFARRTFWVLLPIVVALVFSTVALRYHYATDVLAGALGTVVTLGLARQLDGILPRPPSERDQCQDGAVSDRRPRRGLERGTSHAARTTP